MTNPLLLTAFNHNREGQTIRFNWKPILAGVIIIVLAIYSYREHQSNNKYEKFLSQELANDYNDLIGHLYDAQVELKSASADNQAPVSNAMLAEHLGRIAILAQDFDYFITTFFKEDEGLLHNTSAEVAVNFSSLYYPRSDSNATVHIDESEQQSLIELTDKWIEVLTGVYPGMTSENRNEKLSEYLVNREKFIKSKQWREVIIGLERVSIEYEGVANNL